MVVFRIGAADAEFLETEFAPIFMPVDLVNLPKYHIILRLMINGVASDPFSAVTVPPSPDYFTGNAEKVMKVSRERYSNPVAEVEERITRWMGSDYHQGAALLIGSEDSEEGEESNKVFAEKAADEEPSPKPENFKSEPSREPRPATQVQKPEARQRQPERAQAQQHQKGQKRPPHNSPKQQNKPKKENPIWDTVAQIQKEKLIEAPAFKPELQPEKPQAPEQTSPADAPPEKTVILPGQPHKF
ncbi:MAG: hypothetical protein M1333_00445 [Patescibacteria group bacterium]|nr:hypothetical protein [Patescibacteria group bacterium]